MLSIGIPNPVTPLLWIAGPICGMIVQPIVGAMSDNFHPRFGYSRRKPFILAGALGTVMSMLSLACIDDIVGIFRSVISENASQAMRTVLAFICIYTLNISLQPLQGGVRTMLFESCTREEQAKVAAWYGIIVAVGNVCGYFLGSVSLEKLGLPLLSSMTQFQALISVISILLLATTSITCLYAKEDPFAISKERSTSPGSFTVNKVHRSAIMTAVRDNVNCLRSLPEYVKLVFQIQFFSWLGWFPVIYYQTTWVDANHIQEHILLTGIIDIWLDYTFHRTLRSMASRRSLYMHKL